MIEEQMLKAWVGLSSVIKENRFIKDFNFNEMVVLDNIYENKDISYVELCKKTGLHKSQMNRTINSLIKKDVLIYEVSKLDKRRRSIVINKEHISEYEEEHKRLLNLMSSIKNYLGEEDTVKLIELLDKLGKSVKKGE